MPYEFTGIRVEADQIGVLVQCKDLTFVYSGSAARAGISSMSTRFTDPCFPEEVAIFLVECDGLTAVL